MSIFILKLPLLKHPPPPQNEAVCAAIWENLSSGVTVLDFYPKIKDDKFCFGQNWDFLSVTDLLREETSKTMEKCFYLCLILTLACERSQDNTCSLPEDVQNVAS